MNKLRIRPDPDPTCTVYLYELITNPDPTCTVNHYELITGTDFVIPVRINYIFGLNRILPVQDTSTNKLRIRPDPDLS